MVIYFNKDNKQNGFFKVLGETVGKLNYPTVYDVLRDRMMY